MIGRRDHVWAAVVEAPELYRSHFTGWEETTLGFDQQAARRIMANSWGKGRVLPEQFLAEPCRWATVDYETMAGPNFRDGDELDRGTRRDRDTDSWSGSTPSWPTAWASPTLPGSRS